MPERGAGREAEAKRAEGIEHAADVVLGVVDDAAGFLVPEHGDGDAALERRVGGEVGFAQEGKAVHGIGGVARAVAKGPASFVANRVNDGDAHDVLESLEIAHDERAAGPRTSEGDIEMVTAGGGGMRRGAVGGNPGAKLIVLAHELAVLGSFCGELGFGSHG